MEIHCTDFNRACIFFKFNIKNIYKFNSFFPEIFKISNEYYYFNYLTLSRAKILFSLMYHNHATTPFFLAVNVVFVSCTFSLNYYNCIKLQISLIDFVLLLLFVMCKTPIHWNSR